MTDIVDSLAAVILFFVELAVAFVFGLWLVHDGPAAWLRCRRVLVDLVKR